MIPPGGVADDATSTEEAEQVLPEKYKVMTVGARSKRRGGEGRYSSLSLSRFLRPFLSVLLHTHTQHREVKRVLAAICCDNGGMQMIVLKVLQRTQAVPEHREHEHRRYLCIVSLAGIAGS